MLHEDLKKFYADIFHLARVCLLELQDHILSSYDRSISEYTSQVFSRCAALRSITYQLLSKMIMPLLCIHVGQSTMHNKPAQSWT